MSLTKREAAEQVIENMSYNWVRLKDLAKQANCGRYSLTKMEMARFLYERGDEVEKKLVYVGGHGASLQRRVYRKKKRG